MSNEIKGVSAGGTLYARILNPSGQAWNTSSASFETYASANYADYDIAMTEQGNSGVYCADLPSGITTPGKYDYFIHRQAGASPTEGDVIINTGIIDWSGSAVTSTTSASATLLVTEALIKAGISSPTTAEKSRAADYLLQEILNDIWNKSSLAGNVRLKSLQETLVDVSTDRVRTYDLSAAMDEEVIVEVLDGTRYSTAHAGGSTSITLAADDAGTVANTEGKYILITSGDGVDEIKQITDFNATTKVATVDSAWTTTPGATSTYLVVDTETPLEEVELSEMGSTVPAPGKPTSFAKYDRQLIFNCPWDRSTYGIRIRYFMNIHSLDTTGDASSRWGRIITNWKNVLTQGVYYKTLESIDDSRAPQAKADYENMVTMLLIREIPYGGAFTGFTV